MKSLKEIVQNGNAQVLDFNQDYIRFIWKCNGKGYLVMITTGNGPHISVSRESNRAKKPYPKKEVISALINLCFGSDYKSDTSHLEITKGAFCSHIREIPIEQKPLPYLCKRIN